MVATRGDEEDERDGAGACAEGESWRVRTMGDGFGVGGFVGFGWGGQAAKRRREARGGREKRRAPGASSEIGAGLRVVEVIGEWGWERRGSCEVGSETGLLRGVD